MPEEAEVSVRVDVRFTSWEHRPIAFSCGADPGQELVPAVHGVDSVDE
ncbi:hypothetical protein ACFUTV_07560 [Streptomyces sp. NPDC057298]